MRTSRLNQKVGQALSIIIDGHFEKVRQIESLHDFRVSVRRLRVWLKIAQDNKLVKLKKSERKRIKSLVDLTNDLRDFEVGLALFKQHAANSGAERISKKWEQSVARKYKKLLKDLPQHIAKLPEISVDNRGQVARSEFGEWIRPIVSAYAEQLDTALKKIKVIGNEKAIHRARLSAKALRYMLEPLALKLQDKGPVLTKLRRLQDLCGGLRDGAMLEQRLEKMIPQASLREEKKALMLAAKNNKSETTYLFKELTTAFLSPRAAKVRFAIDIESAICSNK